jgi:hypothetical protein
MSGFGLLEECREWLEVGGFQSLSGTRKFAESVSPFYSVTKARKNADKYETGVNQTLQVIRI